MTRANDLTPLLKRLQLGPMAATLPERIALARREQLDYASFLEIILSDEVNRRAHRRIEMRLHGAGASRRICSIGGLRLVGVHHHGPAAAGRRLLLVIRSGQARACLAGGPGGSRQELPGPGPQATPPSGRGTPSASATPTTTSGPWPKPEWTSFAGAHFPVLPDTRSAHPRRPWPCTGSPPSSPPISTNSYSTGTGCPASSSPAIVPWRNGWVSSTTPSWATAPWTGWPTPATRSSSKAAATGSASRRTVHCWAQAGKEVIDRTTTTR